MTPLYKRFRLPNFALCSLLIALALHATSIHAAITTPGRYLYRETVGAKSHVYSLKATEKDGLVHVAVSEKNRSLLQVCTADGNTQKWHLRRGDTENITAERHGNTMHIYGVHNGKNYDKTVQIDDRPWYQLLSISLQPYLNSTATATSFWMVRSDNLDVVALNAKKQGSEDIVVSGAKTAAQKVVVRADGMFAAFWHATYWYRINDKLFLRYASIQGPPGTDETVIDLVKSLR